MQALDGFIVGASPVLVALGQGILDPVDHLGIEAQLVEELAKLLLQDLFADVGLGALSLVAGAVVVDIPPLLDLPDDRAPAVPAGEQTGEREAVFRPSMAFRVATVENFLNTFPELARDDRIVHSLVDAAVPLEIPHVNPLAENLVDGAEGDRVPSLAEREPFVPRLPSQSFSDIVPVEYHSNSRETIGATSGSGSITFLLFAPGTSR